MKSGLYLLHLLFLVFASFNLSASELNSPRIYDAHIHYSQDVWPDLSPADAIKLLKELGIDRAMVSATPSGGAVKLYQQAPDMVVPMLRPYKDWRHRFLWFKDSQLVPYLKQQMEQAPYRGFGEFHVFGEDMLSQPVKEMVELARQHNMILHAHTDLAGITSLLEMAKGLKVIWAHGGFDVPLPKLTALLKRYPHFYIELSYREGMLDDDDVLVTDWKNALINYPTQFLTGMDTYKPSRWAELPELVAASRGWLNQLPGSVSDNIARNNFERLFVQ